MAEPAKNVQSYFDEMRQEAAAHEAALGPQATQLDPRYFAPLLATCALPVIRFSFASRPVLRDVLFMGTIFATMGYATTIISRHREYGTRWWAGADSAESDAGDAPARE